MKSPRLQNLTIFRMGVLNSYTVYVIWHIAKYLTGTPLQRAPED